MTDYSKKTKAELIHELEEAHNKIARLKSLSGYRESMEKELEEKGQSFKNFFQYSPMGIHVYDLDKGNRLIFRGSNPAADAILGVDNSQFIGKTIEEAFPDLVETQVPERYRRAAALGESWKTEQIIYKENNIDGAFEVYAFRTKSNGMAALFLDITSRKLAEEELKDSEEKYRQLVEFSGDAIYLLYNRKFELINKKFRETFNVTLEDVNSPGFDFMQLVSPSSRPYIEARNERFEKGERLGQNYSFTAISAGNKEIEVEASVAYIKYKAGRATQGILRDVTERQNFEEKLRQAQKMEAIGTLAGGIAHDFNNILMGIQGRTSLILLQPQLSENTLKHLANVEDYIKSATDLTRQLLGFARGGKYEVKPVDLNSLIAKTASLFGRTRKEIKITQDFQEYLWAMEADAGQFEQVLLNLFVNSWQAMPGGGNLYINTLNAPLNEEDVKPYGVYPGNYVKFSVTDTGSGMNDATRKRIFDPFFTTKQMGRGTGLGLATVYGIVKNHGGFIDVYSEVGKGTTFNIYIPASAKVPFVDKEVKKRIRKGKGVILLVDDENIIVDVGVPILESLGYTVLVALNGHKAIEIYKKKSSAIDLVILDVVMPNLSGGETFDQLKKINPQVKVLLSSGYSLHGQAGEIMERGCKGFIQKPFDNYQLSIKLKEILGDD